MTAGQRGSPWLEEFPRERPVVSLTEDQDADVAIVGGGIAGLATAYHLLRGSELRVTVLEKDLVGHGATGHNGGQAVAASEERLADLIRTAGEERTMQGYREMDAALVALRTMLSAMGSSSLLTEVPGVIGIAEAGQLRSWREELDERREMGLEVSRAWVADDLPGASVGGAEAVSRKRIAGLLWSRDLRYSAALEVPVATINSYALVESLASYLTQAFPDRCQIFERSPVERIRMSEEEAAITCNRHLCLADSVVLCTNGYRLPVIEACSPPLLGGRIKSVVGYMAGNEDAMGAPGVRVYMPDEGAYFYLTRRRYKEGWLTAVGGPEGPITGEYDPQRIYHSGAYERLGVFMERTLVDCRNPPDRRWQGLMGYTPTGVRVAGQDPGLPALYYNIGCNGIGLLSAIAGGYRVGTIIRGEELPPSMFDPEVLMKKEIVQRGL
ncbi:MAG: FAD-binding oxidoreductase [Methanomassiliicoccus sp.]|nr:FAD-binding oxidoreductase [Methanomassiliicoccus sp.]